MTDDTIKNKILPLKGGEKIHFFNYLKYYVYVYCELSDDNRRIPIYIGKGKSDRCLQHLSNLDDLSKNRNRKIKTLIAEQRLGLDILAYGLDEKTALSIEAACIDLMGIDNLTNVVRGKGSNINRLPINELSNTLMNKKIEVLKEHRGVAIMINRDYRPWFGDLELFEYTRGIWAKKMVTISENAIYAYSTYEGIVKEVYEIHSWVPAGTQEYFTRSLDPERLKKARWEFVGRKAPNHVRERYNGKILEKPRSYGDPFIKVGLD